MFRPMSRAGHYTSWFTVLLLAVAVMHVYFWWRLVHGTDLPRAWRPALTTLVILLAVLILTPFFANRYFVSPWRETVLWPGYLWMGFAFLLFVTLLASEIPRFFLWLSSRHDAVRWLFLSRCVAAAVVFVALGLGIFSYWNAVRPPRLNRVRVVLPHLSPKLSGTTLLQISDVHLGGLVPRDLLADVVRRANELKPDIVAITGDLVDGSASQHAETIAPIQDLKTKYGVFFVIGNHEYYSGLEPWLAELRRLGVRVLRNERVSIGNGTDSFDLAGVDDPAGKAFHESGGNVFLALQGRDIHRPVVLLAHNPIQVMTAADLGVDFQISGHTHGGQIWPFNFFVRLTIPYIAGLGKFKNTWIYVNEGTGFWGPPMRLGTRAEITLFELVSSSD